MYSKYINNRYTIDKFLILVYFYFNKSQLKNFTKYIYYCKNKKFKVNNSILKNWKMDTKKA